jgi:hypothetical protein
MEPSSSITPRLTGMAAGDTQGRGYVEQMRGNTSRASRCWSSVSSIWKHVTGLVRLAIHQSVVRTSLLAARNPKLCIGLVAVVSLALMGIGLLTNFTLTADDEQIFGPDSWYVA